MNDYIREHGTYCETHARELLSKFAPHVEKILEYSDIRYSKNLRVLNTKGKRVLCSVMGCPGYANHSIYISFAAAPSKEERA